MSNDSLANLSLQLVAQQSLHQICRISATPFAFIANFLIAPTIIVSKPLHNKSHYVILSHAIAAVALAFFGIGLKRYLDFYYQLQATSSSKLYCFFEQLPINWLTKVSGGTCALALAVDRVLCLGLPIFYSTRTTSKYICLLRGAFDNE